MAQTLVIVSFEEFCHERACGYEPVRLPGGLLGSQGTTVPAFAFSDGSYSDGTRHFLPSPDERGVLDVREAFLVARIAREESAWTDAKNHALQQHAWHRRLDPCLPPGVSDRLLRQLTAGKLHIEGLRQELADVRQRRQELAESTSEARARKRAAEAARQVAEEHAAAVADVARQIEQLSI